MAITNAQIIAQASKELADAGVIGFTGRTFEIPLADGTVLTFPETEPIHTYSHWKELGYQVRKGQRAVTKLTIWKHAAGKRNEETGESETPERMFMKTAAFFSASQVDAIEKGVTNEIQVRHEASRFLNRLSANVRVSGQAR